jgi:hypothetical protein
MSHERSAVSDAVPVVPTRCTGRASSKCVQVRGCGLVRAATRSASASPQRRMSWRAVTRSWTGAGVPGSAAACYALRSRCAAVRASGGRAQRAAARSASAAARRHTPSRAATRSWTGAGVLGSTGHRCGGPRCHAAACAAAARARVRRVRDSGAHDSGARLVAMRLASCGGSASTRRARTFVRCCENEGIFHGTLSRLCRSRNFLPSPFWRLIARRPGCAQVCRVSARVRRRVERLARRGNELRQ